MTRRSTQPAPELERDPSSATQAAGEPIVFDRAADYYDLTRGYPPGVADQAAELLCRAGGLGPKSRVIEIGIGTGRIALPLGLRVDQMVGVDRSIPMLRRLLQKPGAERTQPVIGDITALPFGSARFEAAIGVHVFHLVPDWRRALTEVKRVLIPSGLLLLATDNQLLPELWLATHARVPKPANAGAPSGPLDFPLQEGFKPAGQALELRYTQRVELRIFLHRIEERVWSSTWRLTDVEHAALVAAMRSAIMDRYGSLDTVLEVERAFSVRCFTSG
jgi:ubiquinone/menaquinone biosynthesis C-methylase UbiE